MPQAVEFTKLQSLLAAMLTLLSMVAYIALQLAWSLRQLDCDGAYQTRSISLYS